MGPRIQTGENPMLGIDDVFVALAYTLSVGSTILCVVYSWRNWHRGDDSVHDEDVRWAQTEEKIETNL